MRKGPSLHSIHMSLVALLVAGCGSRGQEHGAHADIAPLGDHDVRGTVELSTARDGKIKMEAKFSGLTPGLHGFHVHEIGDCTADDGASAGDHFNPGHVAHGGPGSAPHHAGDLGNLVADAQGRATLTLETDAFTLDAGERSVLGRSFVVHAGADDLHTDPAGNAGARIGCGVIRANTR